jgi:hypothetical protein
MPSAFSVANSPVTTAGTLAVTGAGTVSQYIRGDGSLADFPATTGGGASVSYYLNGSVSQGTIGGVAYREVNRNPVFGTGTDITRNSDGYIASFITDAGDPNKLLIPAGNWNLETYFSASSGGGSPTFYVELYKYDGTTFTLIASSATSPELIAFGTNLNPYFSTLAVPQTTLTLTDRLALRFYVNTSGRTITLHTENDHLCQVITTFTTGLTALNGLTSQVQFFAVGTSGTDFAISSATDTHTFNLPTASATNRGALSSADWSTFNAKMPAITFNSPLFIASGGEVGIRQASGSQNGFLSSTDWTTFNNKQNALTLTTTGTSGAATLVGSTLNIPIYSPDLSGYVPTSRTLTINGTTFDLSANRSWSVGTVTSVAALTLGTSGTDLSSTVANGTTTPVITLNVPTASATNRGALSAADWTTFNNKQNALTNPVTGTGTTNYLPKFTGSTTIGNSLLTDNGTTLAYGNNIISVGASNTSEKYLEFGSSNGAYYVGGTSSEHYIFGQGDKPLRLYTNGTVKATLTSGGNLLVGTTTDSGARLRVNGGQLYITNTIESIVLNEVLSGGQYALYKLKNASFTVDLGLDNTGLYFEGSTGATRFFGGGSERMRITSGGNVGIGTSLPQNFNAAANQLVVGTSSGNNGITIAAGTNAFSCLFFADGTSGNEAFRGYIQYNHSTDGLEIGTAASERMRITSGGNVGIGNNAPPSDTRLTTRATSSSGYNLLIEQDNGLDGFVLSCTSADGVLKFFRRDTSGTNTVERARLTAGGEFIIGITDNGAYNLQCNGTGVWGAGAYVNGSDRNIKDNISTIEKGLEYIEKMNPVRFKYKPNYTRDHTMQTGFIAQELQEVFANEDYLSGLVQNGVHLSVAYQNLLPILVKAIQELNDKIK